MTPEEYAEITSSLGSDDTSQRAAALEKLRDHVEFTEEFDERALEISLLAFRRSDLDYFDERPLLGWIWLALAARNGQAKITVMETLLKALETSPEADWVWFNDAVAQIKETFVSEWFDVDLPESPPFSILVPTIQGLCRRPLQATTTEPEQERARRESIFNLLELALELDPEPGQELELVHLALRHLPLNPSEPGLPGRMHKILPGWNVQQAYMDAVAASLAAIPPQVEPDMSAFDTQEGPHLAIELLEALLNLGHEVEMKTLAGTLFDDPRQKAWLLLLRDRITDRDQRRTDKLAASPQMQALIESQ